MLRLSPKYIRYQNHSNNDDTYFLTLDGVLAGSAGENFRIIFQSIADTIRGKYEEDPDYKAISWKDLKFIGGLQEEDRTSVQLAMNSSNLGSSSGGSSPIWTIHVDTEDAGRVQSLAGLFSLLSLHDRRLCGKYIQSCLRPWSMHLWHRLIDSVQHSVDTSLIETIFGWRARCWLWGEAYLLFTFSLNIGGERLVSLHRYPEGTSPRARPQLPSLDQWLADVRQEMKIESTDSVFVLPAPQGFYSLCRLPDWLLPNTKESFESQLHLAVNACSKHVLEIQREAIENRDVDAYAGGTSIHYGFNGALEKIVNVESKDAVEILKNTVNVGGEGFAAPATPSPSNNLVPNQIEAGALDQRARNRRLTLAIVAAAILLVLAVVSLSLCGATNPRPS